MGYSSMATMRPPTMIRITPNVATLRIATANAVGKNTGTDRSTGVQMPGNREIARMAR